MSYSNNFTHADDVVTHLNSVVPLLTDPLLQAKYVGFVAIVATTVYELAVKEIFISFGTKKHKVFGAYTESHFRRINGRIKIKAIKDDYIIRFGKKYQKRFEANLKKRSKDFLLHHRRDIMSSYSNIITWRNEFAHAGSIRTNATYAEATRAYEDGKEIIHCLAETMTR